jgi:hypothetical protein
MGSEAEAAQLPGVALPVLGHLDVQVEVDSGAQERLDVPTGGGPDLLQPGQSSTASSAAA